MGGFSFIHAADLHLDSPWRGFEQINYQDDAVAANILKQLRDCTFTALDRIVQACLAHQVNFLVLAGDVFDVADASLRAQLRLRDAVARLAEAQIPVFWAYGNHDHAQGVKAKLEWPDNLHIFPPGEVTSFPVLVAGEQVARVYGISYPQRDVTDNYAALFQRHPDDPFAVALLHSNVGGLAEHANYAPSSLQQLAQAGFDYWALGHVHQNQILMEYPWVVYPGTPQGRQPLETGVKGCYLVQVSAQGLVQTKFLATAGVGWEHLAVSIEGLATGQELLEQLENQLLELRQHGHAGSYVVRITLHGRGVLHRQLMLEAALEDILEELRYRFAGPSGPFIWVESIRNRTAAAIDKKPLLGSATLLGDLLDISQQAQSDGELQSQLKQVLEPLYQRAARYLDRPSELQWQQLLEDAENLALDLLWDEEVPDEEV